MPTYYVHTKKDNQGDYEVHKDGCAWMPKPENRKRLGNFTNCRDAVREAKKDYPSANGCYHCSRECHTS